MSDAITPSQLRSFFDRLVTIAATIREARGDIADIKQEDPQKRIDWTRLCALAAAYDADQHDAKKNNRVKNLIAKAEYASWYAGILKIGSEKNEQIEPTRSSSPERPAPQKRTPVSVPREAIQEAQLVSGEPVRAYPAPSPPAPQPHDDGQSADLASAINGAGSPLADDEGIPEFLRRPMVLQ